MFQWFYWHALLPGRDIPGIGSAMPIAGKDVRIGPSAVPVGPTQTKEIVMTTTATIAGVTSSR